MDLLALKNKFRMRVGLYGGGGDFNAVTSYKERKWVSVGGEEGRWCTFVVLLKN